MSRKDEIDFIALRYKEEHFRIAPALHRITGKTAPRWHFTRIAATVGVAIALAATATIVVRHHLLSSSGVDDTSIETVATPSAAVSKIIDFEDVPLPQVIEKIKEVYGVDVINLPDNASDYQLSLHYEGNAENLIATINEILDTHLAIKQ